MLIILLYTIALLLSFYLLYIFTEFYFIRSLDRLSQRLEISSDIAGSTLMAAGSSAPELAVMVISVLKTGHHEAIGVGTIVGSALFNLFVITGVVMIVKQKARLSWQPMVRDLLFYALTVVLMILSFRDGDLSAGEAGAFLLLYGGYLLTMLIWKKKFFYLDRETPSGDSEDAGPRWVGHLNHYLRHIFPAPNLFLIFFLSIVVITFLAWVLVESAIVISVGLGVPEIFIALVVIAVGTSVPDLVSSVIVARQGRAGMAINNAVGSNIFDILIGLGLPFFLYHLFSAGQISLEKTDLGLSFAFLMGSTLFLLLFFLLNKWYTKRGAGILLILLYMIYLYLEMAGVINM